MTDKIQKWLVWFGILTTAPIAWAVIVATVNYWEALLWIIENIDAVKGSVEAYRFDRLPRDYN